MVPPPSVGKENAGAASPILKDIGLPFVGFVLLHNDPDIVLLRVP
jgi:hypothetical protein